MTTSRRTTSRCLFATFSLTSLFGEREAAGRRTTLPSATTRGVWRVTATRLVMYPAEAWYQTALV